MAFARTTILSAGYRLPLFFDEVSRADAPNSRLTAKFAPFGTQASWLSERLLIGSGSFCFQAALSQFGLSRFRLKWPLWGVLASVLFLVLLASSTGELNVRAGVVPAALGARWVNASFGFGAGLVTVLASLTVWTFAGAIGVLAPALLVQSVAIVVFSKDGKCATDGMRADFFSGLLAERGRS